MFKKSNNILDFHIICKIIKKYLFCVNMNIVLYKLITYINTNCKWIEMYAVP